MLTYLGYCRGCGSLVKAAAVTDPDKPHVMRQIAQALAEMAGLIVTTQAREELPECKKCTCEPVKPAFDPKNAELPRFHVQGQINYIIPGKVEIDQVVFAESREEALLDIEIAQNFNDLEDMPEWDKHTLEIEELPPLSQAEVLEALGVPKLPGF